MQHQIDLSLGHGAEGEKLLKCLRDRPGVTLLFGAADTGKTTLIRNLASSVAPHALTAIVDSDAGQSSVGPPACVGACLVKGALKSQTKAEMLHFVGNFYPQGHFLPLLSGLVRLLGFFFTHGGGGRVRQPFESFAGCFFEQVGAPLEAGTPNNRVPLCDPYSIQ